MWTGNTKFNRNRSRIFGYKKRIDGRKRHFAKRNHGYLHWTSFKAQWLLYVPPGLAVTNSTFCAHSVFVCFVWISEQTTIISLYSIN